MAWDPAFEAAFNPKTVAIAGVARERPGTNPLGGNRFIAAFEELGFKGKIFPINPNATEIHGLKCYPNLTAVPEKCDLVIASVRREYLPPLLKECIATGNRNIHCFTAGFDETGTEEGKKLGDEIKQIAIDGKLRMLGPNCLGLGFIPRAGMASWEGLPKLGGHVAFLSQSGGHSEEMAFFGSRWGIFFSKVISYGNAYVMDCTDFLEYFAKDDETKIMAMYLEGVKDGPKLLKQVTEMNPKKPVIVWKGGVTSLGARAVSSHTGSLAGQMQIWNAFYKQSGAIRAGSLDEATDILQAFQYMPPPPGRRVTLLLGGGGRSVATADICGSEGLDVPVLGKDTQKALQDLVMDSGTSVKNPIDATAIFRSPEDLEKAVTAVTNDPVTDITLVVFNMAGSDSPKALERWLGNADFLTKFAKGSKKPLGVVIYTRGDPTPVWNSMETVRRRLLEGGVAVFSTLPNAALALSRLVNYYEFYKERGITPSYKPIGYSAEKL